MVASKKHGRGTRALQQLAGTIEGEIIPRLLMAHRLGPWTPGREDVRPAVGPTEVAEFTRLVLQHEARVARAYVRGLQGQGTDLETLLLELLAPAARTLGDLWSADLTDFTQVTVAMGRLQEILHDLCPGLTAELQPHRGAPSQRAVLAPAPGEQHTLGVALVAEFMRRSGWEVLGGAGHCRQERARGRRCPLVRCGGPVPEFGRKTTGPGRKHPDDPGGLPQPRHRRHGGWPGLRGAARARGGGRRRRHGPRCTPGRRDRQPIGQPGSGRAASSVVTESR